MAEGSFRLDRDFAMEMDREDPLSAYRRKFVIPDSDLIYLDGNSLGRLPQRTAARMREVVEEEWGENLIRSWNAGWFEAPSRIGELLGRIIGADPGETVMSDSTTVNLFKLIMAALQHRSDRSRVVSDVLNFPSDLYAVQGCIETLDNGHELYLVPSRDDIEIDLDRYWQAVDDRTALVTFSHVTFKSGYLFDVKTLVDHAHRVGALVLLDMSHSVGVVPAQLGSWGVDMAVGCSYKYLNGGPGSPAFLYVREDLRDQIRSPIWGWIGGSSPFDFGLEYRPLEGVQKFLVGTPPILSLLALESSLEMILEAGLIQIREKSVKLTSYMRFLFEKELFPFGFDHGSPSDPKRRGSHVSFRHEDGYSISQALIEKASVLPDFRAPDNIRFGLAPLYTSFLEVWEAVARLKAIMQRGSYKNAGWQKAQVT